MGSLRSGEVNARPGVHATDGTACRVLVIADGPAGQEITDLIEAGDSEFACEVVSRDEGPGLISDGSHDAYVLAHAADASVFELLAYLVSSGPGPVVVLTDSEDRDADLMALEAGASGYLAKDRLDAGTLQRTLRYAVATWGARRRTEDGYRRYQNLAAAAYDDSSVAKAIVSLEDGHLVSVNDSLCELLGYDRDELVGLHFSDFTHPEDVDNDAFQFQRMVDEEIDSYIIEKRYLRYDGSLVWGRLQASLIGGDRGHRYALGQVVDVTEQKEAEDHIAFQASLFQQMRTPVVATDIDGIITHWNEQAEAAYGWSAEEAEGKDFASLVLPEIDDAQMGQIRADMRQGGLWEGELVLSRRDGSTFPAWTSGVVVRDRRGRPAGIVSSIVDLTDVQRARQAASTQEILSRSLLEAVSVPIAVLAASGQIVSSNPSWGTGTDRATHRYLPKSVTLEAESETLRELTTGVDAVLAGEEARFVLEYPHETSEGERWTRVVAIPVADGGAILCYWDITDERFARLALEETIRAKDEFITSISHELRTPLSVVVGLSETLRIGAQDPSEMNDFHDLIADQAQEMAMIVEDLLIAGRIDSQTLTVRATMVDLPDEIDAVLRPWGKSEELEVGVRLRPGAEKVYADSLRVRQILRNLVTNATRYGKPPIEIKAVRARDRVILSVSDQGQGVPEDALDRMFQPYARFGTVEGQPSSVGLGLHVARRLARFMGGDLVYKREAGLTTFLLSLPAESPDDSGRSSNGLHLVMD